MKTIELKHVKDDEKAIDFDYRANLLTIVSAPLGGEGAIKVPEIRQALKIGDKIEAASDKLELEDAEYEFLRLRVRAWPWARAHRVIVDFVDAIEAAGTPQ